MGRVRDVLTPREAVPEWLRGCWRRVSIDFADGSSNLTDTVYWLQTDSAMVDVRIAAGRPSFAGVTSFEQCSPAQRAALATTNASTGFTTATDVMTHADGTHSCVAQWFTYGYGVNFQPECQYPEPGLLAVDVTGAVMIERAPSGAYEEEWHRVPGSHDGSLSATVLDDGRHLFVAGPIAVLVRDRTSAEELDCEFSVALRDGDGVYRIQVSTLPWREGAVVDAPL